jgi:hypothetical protein
MPLGMITRSVFSRLEATVFTFSVKWPLKASIQWVPGALSPKGKTLEVCMSLGLVAQIMFGLDRVQVVAIEHFRLSQAILFFAKKYS